jgi:Molybdopterin-binding domain of aldehyde dehydrogenase
VELSRLTGRPVKLVLRYGEDLRDGGAGGSRLTAGMAAAADAAARAWRNRLRDEPVVIELDEGIGMNVGSYVVQIAQVAVDPVTGQLRVLEILTAVDVASVVNPAAHQMQDRRGRGYGLWLRMPGRSVRVRRTGMGFEPGGVQAAIGKRCSPVPDSPCAGRHWSGYGECEKYR